MRLTLEEALERDVLHSMRSLKRGSLEMRMHHLFVTTDAKWNQTKLAPTVVPRSSEKPV
jgi:hypothetical protein